MAQVAGFAQVIDIGADGEVHSVCVFYLPNVQNMVNWTEILEAITTLH